MQAGNCCLNSTRLSFLLANLSLLLIDKKRLQACTVWFCPPVICDFQAYVSMQTNDLKAGVHHLHWDLFRLSWNYLETGLHSMQLLCSRQALHSPVAVKWLHLHLFPGSWLSSMFSSLSCQVAGTGFAITYSIVLFFPIFDQVPCESHLKKQNKWLHFPSPFPVPLSGATLRDFLSTHSRLKVKIIKLQCSAKGSM